MDKEYAIQRKELKRIKRLHQDSEKDMTLLIIPIYIK